MKSADNHTKRKAPVEAFFYRELMSHGRITIPPLGSFLAGQKYTQPRHTDYDTHVRRLIITKTQWHHLRAHTNAATLQEKKMFECVFSLPPTSPVHSPCLCLRREERRVSRRSHSESLSSCLPISPSHFSVRPVCLSLSRHHTVLSILSCREYQHVKLNSSLRARWMSL